MCVAKTFTHIKELFPNLIKGIKGRENYDEDWFPLKIDYNPSHIVELLLRRYLLRTLLELWPSITLEMRESLDEISLTKEFQIEINKDS